MEGGNHACWIFLLWQCLGRSQVAPILCEVVNVTEWGPAPSRQEKNEELQKKKEEDFLPLKNTYAVPYYGTYCSSLLGVCKTVHTGIPVKIRHQEVSYELYKLVRNLRA